MLVGGVLPVEVVGGCADDVHPVCPYGNASGGLVVDDAAEHDVRGPGAAVVMGGGADHVLVVFAVQAAVGLVVARVRR